MICLVLELYIGLTHIYSGERDKASKTEALDLFQKREY